MSTSNDQIVKDAGESTAYILNEIKDAKAETIERIASSDRRTTEIFSAHEQRDQERFSQIQTEVVDSRKGIYPKLDKIVDAVDKVDGRLSQVETQTTVIKDRADQIAKQKALQITKRHALIVGLASAAATAFVVGVVGAVLKATGVA